MLKSYLLPRLRDILFLAVFIADVLLGPRMLNIDGDLPRHLLMGKIVLQTHTIPTSDIFSYVYKGTPLIPHEWLAGVVFYVTYTLLGLDGVALLAATLLAASFLLVYEEARHVSTMRLPALALTAWGAAITSLHWITRPHLFTMLFLALYLIWANQLQSGRSKRFWLFPLTMLLWGNMHGEFIAGLLVLGAYGAGWLWDNLFSAIKPPIKTGKNLGLAFASSLLVTLINPVGLHTWETVVGYLNNRYLMSRINETNPPDFSQPQFMVLLIMLGFSIYLLATHPAKIETGQAFALAGFSMMSLLAARNVHLYGIAAPLLLANAISGRNLPHILQNTETLFEQVESKLRGLAWPIITVFTIGSLVQTNALAIQNRFSPKMFPVQATNWLENNPQTGNMFNAFDWGGYLLWRLWPTHLTFIDSQTDVRGDVSREYEKIITLSDNWQQTLQKYSVQWVIIPPNWPLAKALLAEGWRQIYRDETTTIFTR
ncbi:MAG: hypothetical protein Fur0016_30750 [Anaerolineales bacterium]